jgi:hemoglobin
MFSENKDTLYDLLGGEKGIRKLVGLFYARVQKDPLLSPLFPADISPVRDKQFLFLSQFFGGPPLYSELYGHPMMRARHMPFPINSERADAWLNCMAGALTEMNINQQLLDALLERLKGTAYHFINTPDN